MSTQIPCPFCDLPQERILGENAHGRIIADAFPVSPGHRLVIARRHISSLFDLTPEERESLFDLVSQARIELDRERSPKAYNVGVNDGVAAGQTIPHVHIHLIPRYDGDQEDPRGGVRWIFPAKANYWKERG